MSDLTAAALAAPLPEDDPDADVALMLALQRGQDSALNGLMQRWRGPLIAFFLRSTGRAEEAADLAQETFVRVYTSRARYQPSGKFSTWLFTIAANLARNFARWRGRHPTVELAGALEDGETAESAMERLSLNPPPGAPDALPLEPGQALEAEERARAVRAAIRSLPEDMREALILFTYHDLSYRDIAKIQGTREKNVENRLYRARVMLKERLAGLMER